MLDWKVANHNHFERKGHIQHWQNPARTPIIAYAATASL
jgi:hypothetical protein